MSLPDEARFFVRVRAPPTAFPAMARYHTCRYPAGSSQIEYPDKAGFRQLRRHVQTGAALPTHQATRALPESDRVGEGQKMDPAYLRYLQSACTHPQFQRRAYAGWSGRAR